MKTEILKITRSTLKLRIGNKTIEIDGEAHHPGYGSPDFVAYINSIEKWNSPHDNQIIDAQTKKQIIETVQELLKQKNMKVEFE